MSWLSALQYLPLWFPFHQSFFSLFDPPCCYQHIFLLDTNLCLAHAFKPLNSQLLPMGVNSKFLCQAYQNIYSLVSTLFTPFLPGHCCAMATHFSFSTLFKYFLKQQWPSLCLYPNCSFSLKNVLCPLLFHKCSCFYNLLKDCVAFSGTSPINACNAPVAFPLSSLPSCKGFIISSGILSPLCTLPLHYSQNKSYLWFPEGKGCVFHLPIPSYNPRAWHFT